MKIVGNLLYLALIGCWISPSWIFASTSRSDVNTLVVLWGHSNCRDGLVPMTQAAPQNTFQYFPFIGAMPMPQPPTMGGLATELAMLFDGITESTYFLNVCPPSTSFQPLSTLTGNPDFSGVSPLRPLILQAMTTAIAQHGIRRVISVNLEPTGDLIYFVTSSIGSISQISTAYIDLANAVHATSTMSGVKEISHLVILMDGGYSLGSPLAPYQKQVIDQQMRFVLQSGAIPVSAEGATFPDDVHYDPSFIPILAKQIKKAIDH